jgi:hypothetical protein
MRRLPSQIRDKESEKDRLQLTGEYIDILVQVKEPYSAVDPPLSSCYHIPFLRNKRFVSRTGSLQQLTQKLLIEKECQKLAIVGLGGIGKTQVTLKFAYRVKEGWPKLLQVKLKASSRIL